MKKIQSALSQLDKYKYLLYELVSRDIKIRYRRSVLGLLWTLLNPVLMMMVQTAVFSNIFRFEIEHFPVYLFTANILFSFMTESTTNAMYSIEEGSALIKKVYVPKYIFPISKVFASVVNLFFSMIALFLVMIVTRVPFHMTVILIPIDLVYIVLFCVGLGMILASLQTFFRDVAHLYSVFTMAWMYLTPIFYPESLLAGKMKMVLTLNPMVYFIRFMREAVLYHAVPSMTLNMTCMVIAVGMLLIGSYVFEKRQERFILYI